MTRTISVEYHPYRYFEYELELARREIDSVLEFESCKKIDNGYLLKNCTSDDSQLSQLVYFGAYRHNGTLQDTLQARLEATSLKHQGRSRQATRYSVHGLHEYKGKFNPQIVRGVLNTLGVDSASTVLDPFCGSGTSLVECAHIGSRAIGMDVNPLAVYVANTKIAALSMRTGSLRKAVDGIRSIRFSGASKFDEFNERERYLRDWFPDETLRLIEQLRLYLNEIPSKPRAVLSVLISDQLRDYSLQEPADLRIRRRKTPLPDKDFIEVLLQRAYEFCDQIERTRNEIAATSPARAYLADCRKPPNNNARWSTKPPFDAAITSPPYATALPYIDTQRLSLVWLSLIQPCDIARTEARLTGSREFRQRERDDWKSALLSNTNSLPDSCFDFCLELENALSQSDGFRRQATPKLLYRYLSDMMQMFRSMRSLMAPSAPFALLVGHNHTTLGGQRFDIDTPDLLRELAISVGWREADMIPLQTYQRYGLHASNSVKAETMVLLTNER